MTRAEYLKSIEDALLEQGRNLRTKEDADRLFESLGITDLFTRINKATKRTAKRKLHLRKRTLKK